MLYIDTHHQHIPGFLKGAGLKIDFCKSPRLRCFGVLIAFIEGAKGTYEVTAPKSTFKWSKYGQMRPIFLMRTELVLKKRSAVQNGA